MNAIGEMLTTPVSVVFRGVGLVIVTPVASFPAPIAAVLLMTVL